MADRFERVKTRVHERVNALGGLPEGSDVYRVEIVSGATPEECARAMLFHVVQDEDLAAVLDGMNDAATNAIVATLSGQIAAVYLLVVQAFASGVFYAEEGHDADS